VWRASFYLGAAIGRVDAELVLLVRGFASVPPGLASLHLRAEGDELADRTVTSQVIRL